MKPFSSKPQDNSGRLDSLDLLRGLIILIMALDHVAWIELAGRPTEPFWTGHFPAPMSWARFVTFFLPHFCAPGFFVLLGVGMSLFSASRLKQGWSNNKVLAYFLVRGTLLILMQFTVENLVWVTCTHSNLANWFYVGVLFSLGSAMIFSAIVMRLFSEGAFLISLGILFLCPLLMPDASRYDEPLTMAWKIFFVPSYADPFDVYFSVFPWAALALLGTQYGKLLLKNTFLWLNRSLWVGIVCIVAFVLFRTLGGNYANLREFNLVTAQDFFSVVKFPPSLAFMSITVGGCALALYGLRNLRGVCARVLIVFGRVPLFFYLFHLYVLAEMWILLSDTGLSLGWVYGLWVVLLVASYPFCVGYGRFKFRQPPDSLWRLL